MPSAQPHLASWERRLLACVLDTALLTILLGVLYGVVPQDGVIVRDLMPGLALLYVGYHAAALLWPRLSLGRTVANVAVLSIKGSDLSATQAIARPLVRMAMLTLACMAGNAADAAWLIALPFVIELALMAHTHGARTLADTLAGTMVVNRPPVQPHRAPAYPMYSAKDEEFGPKP